MSKVHFFQRYSTKENTVTNNTLQLFAQIYNHSPSRLDELMEVLIGTPLDIGIEINQQGRGKKSVPDGLLTQRSFKLVIEAKVDSPNDVDQLISHCDSFANEDKKILMLLTIDELSPTQEREIARRISEKNKTVLFKNVTYQKISKALENFFSAHEGAIVTIAEDYQNYCRDVGLVSGAEFFMRIVPTGKSFEINNKYAMYFDRADRGYSQHAFIGFYINKAVRSIIRVRSIFEITYKNGDLNKTLVSGENTDVFDGKIIKMIKDAKEECGYDVATNHKFFCGDETFPTNFVKTSPQGILGPRYQDLRQFDVKGTSSTADIASILAKQTWK